MFSGQSVYILGPLHLGPQTQSQPHPGHRQVLPLQGQTHIVPTAPFRLNDGGRQHSKRPRQRNDCTVRAVAIASSIPYDSAYDLLKANGRKCSRGIRLRPLFEGALLNEYRFKWIAFPAVRGYLRMYTFAKSFRAEDR